MSENNGEDKKQSSLQRYLYAADKERLRTLLEEMSQIAAASIETAVGALRSGDAVLAEKYQAYRDNMAAQVMEKNRKLQEQLQ